MGEMDRQLDETAPGPDSAKSAPPPAWLLTIAQLPTEDPASRMRVLRTLESLGAAGSGVASSMCGIITS